MTGEGVSVSPEPGNTQQAVSSIFPAMRFSWEIKSVDAVFCNGGSYGIPRINDLTKEAMLQAITDQDLRFLAVMQLRNIRYRIAEYKDIRIKTNGENKMCSFSTQ